MTNLSAARSEREVHSWPGVLSALAVLLSLLLAARPASAQITIYRDAFGTPSISGKSLADGAYGLGYCMATDGAEQMSRNYHQARGRMAEIEGRSGLFGDIFMRSLGMEKLAEEHAQHLSPLEATLISSFCAGANRAIEEQKGHLPDWVELVTPVDVLTLSQFVNSAFPLLDLASELFPGRGSNQFALAPSRTTTGHALLSMDPHLDWDGPFAWYEFAEYAGDVHFHGVTLFGVPVGVMGHTDHVAWAMTNNSPKLYDLFQIATSSDHPNEYNYHGTWRKFDSQTMTMRYRVKGELKSEDHTVKMTAWGPIVPFHNVAARFSTFGSWEMIAEAVRMAQARNAHEFREALRPCGLSMWNIVYADTHGAIGYQYNARVPKRDSSFDWTKPVPGADPKTEWGPLWSIDALPHIENPKSGLLVNCNSAPQLTPTDNELQGDWPAYVTSFGHTTRYDRLSSLLMADSHVNPTTAKRYATDTLVPYAKQTVAALAQATTVGTDPPAAVTVLQHWSGRCDKDAVGCALYYYWLMADPECVHLSEQAVRGKIWTPEQRDKASKALEKAVSEMQATQGSVEIPWGKLHFAQRGDKRQPVNGFHIDEDSVASVVPNSGPYRKGEMRCVFGSSFRMIVDLDPHGVHSWSILPYGDSQVSGTSHFDDQMDLYSQGKYKDTVFGLERIKRAAVSQKVIMR
jgi:acyl-homoserine lactone acylase PvdQ